MERLNEQGLTPFVEQPGAAIVLFASDEGHSCLDQAQALALLWMQQRKTARFGYVDVLTSRLIQRRFALRVLPTTIIFISGAQVLRFDGYHSRSRLAAAFQELGVAPLAA